METSMCNCLSLCLETDTSEWARRVLSVGGWLKAAVAEPTAYKKTFMLKQALKILYKRGGCPTCISWVEEALRYAKARDIQRRYHNEKISL